MGVKGLCTIKDGLVRVELSHGLLGGAVVGQVKSYIEEKLDQHLRLSGTPALAAAPRAISRAPPRWRRPAR